MFAFSKIVAFLISPINWIAFAFLYGLIARKPSRKRKGLILGTVLFFVFTNTFIVSKAMRLVQVPTIQKAEIEKPFKAGILLGGFLHYRSDTTRVVFNANGDRLFQTLDLYHSGLIEKILITSGSGMLQLPGFKEADVAKDYLVRIGVPADDILVESRSRNTYENAVQSKALLDSLGWNTSEDAYLLITSASHIRRSVGCFEKQGFEVVPYATTYRAEGAKRIIDMEHILPNTQALAYWKSITHEIFGLLAYRLKGFI